MKRIIAFIFALAILFSFTAITASAEDGVTLSANSPAGAISDTVTVDVTLAKNSGIIGMTLWAEYDSSQLTLVKVENGDIFGSIYITSQDYKVNPYCIAFLDYASNKNYTKTGSLVKLHFKIKSTAKENTASTVKLYSDDAIKYPKNQDVPVFGTTSIIKIANKANLSSADQSGSSKVEGSSSNTVSNSSNTTTSGGVLIEDNTPETIITSSGYDSELEKDTEPKDKEDKVSSEEEILGMGFDAVLLIVTAAGIIVAVGIIVIIALVLKKKE